MFKLLLVDDFFIERENVKQIIQNSGLEIRIMGDASNGKEALEIMEGDLPDFVLTDIEMPFIGGLELAERIKQKYPSVKIIFLTFYEKFEYAKKAIALEASSYILKPIDKEEMISALKKMIKEKTHELQANQEDGRLRELLNVSMPLLLDKFKRDLFMGFFKNQIDIKERLDFFNLHLSEGTYLVLTAEIDNFEQFFDTKSLEYREMLSIKISGLFGEAISDNKQFIWCKVDSLHWAILLFGIQLSASELLEQGYCMADNLIHQLGQSGISISIGVSSIFGDITKISKMYEQALDALQYKFNLGQGQIINYMDIEESSEKGGDFELTEIQKKLVKLFHSNNEDELEEFINQLFLSFNPLTSQNKIKNICFNVIIFTQMFLNDSNATFSTVFGEEHVIWEQLLKFETILDVKKWLKDTLMAVTSFVSNHSNRQSSLIVKAKKVIEEHYNEQITVKSIADHLYYSANYLNNVFKQETGETILEYISRSRVEKAKELLGRPELKMYEITNLVGYNHESHFRNMFKQYTGRTPREFRESLRGG